MDNDNSSSQFNYRQVSDEELKNKLSQRKKYLDDTEDYLNKIRTRYQQERNKSNKKELKDLLEYELREKKKIQDEVNRLEWERIERIADKEEKHEAKLRQIRKENAQKREEAAMAAAITREEKISSKIQSTVFSVANGLKSALDSILDSYVASQEALNYGFTGTSNNLEKITKLFGSTFGGQGIVKQAEVYNNLTELVNQGIIYNVEQRAFLKTISDDLGGIFDATDGSLTRLINLQRRDLTSNRMAIRASLKEFLNQNYETSQYIKNGFRDVSSSLLEAQAIMDTNSAVAMEAVVQQWLGALSSVGMSSDTISQLATAIGQLGSGNLNALNGSSMQNLLVMGAARANISYADLLMEGVSADAADALMKGIVSYMTEIGQTAGNVVKSEYARIFGLNVSDLVAASQVGNPTQNGWVSDDINNLLKGLDEYVTDGRYLDNKIRNLVTNWAMKVAEGDTYKKYRLRDIAADVVGGIANGIGIERGVTIDFGQVAQILPLMSTLGDLMSSAGTTMQPGFSTGDWKSITKTLVQGNLQKAMSDTFEQLLAGGREEGEATKMFDSLGLGYKTKTGRRDQYIRNVGDLTGFKKTSGLDVSGALIIANSDTNDLVRNTYNSAKDFAKEALDLPDEYYGTTEIYKLLDFSTGTPFSDAFTLITEKITSINEGINSESGTNALLRNLTDLLTESASTINDTILSLPNYIYETSTSILSSANTVTIGNDISYLQDVMLVSSINIQNIYNLLYAYMGGRDAVYNNASTYISNTEANWNWAIGPAMSLQTAGGTGV